MVRITHTKQTSRTDSPTLFTPQSKTPSRHNPKKKRLLPDSNPSSEPAASPVSRRITRSLSSKLSETPILPSLSLESGIATAPRSATRRRIKAQTEASSDSLLLQTIDTLSHSPKKPKSHIISTTVDQPLYPPPLTPNRGRLKKTQSSSTSRRRPTGKSRQPGVQDNTDVESKDRTEDRHNTQPSSVVIPPSTPHSSVTNLLQSSSDGGQVDSPIRRSQFRRIRKTSAPHSPPLSTGAPVTSSQADSDAFRTSATTLEKPATCLSPSEPRTTSNGLWLDNTIEEDLAFVQKALQNGSTGSTGGIDQIGITDPLQPTINTNDADSTKRPSNSGVTHDTQPDRTASSVTGTHFISSEDAVPQSGTPPVTAASSSTSQKTLLAYFPTAQLQQVIPNACTTTLQRPENPMTCATIKKEHLSMPFTAPPQKQELLAASKLPLPNSMTDLVYLFTTLDQVIQQRRKRREPLLFTRSHPGGLPLKDHVERVGKKTFSLMHLRQIAWIAPHLISLEWARVPDVDATPSVAWDLEIQQRLFLPTGPTAMLPLKPKEMKLRIEAFRYSCVYWVYLSHSEFLVKRALHTATPIPLASIKRWHNTFDLEKAAFPIPPIDLPARPTTSRTPARWQHVDKNSATPSRLTSFDLEAFQTVSTPLKQRTRPSNDALTSRTPPRTLTRTPNLPFEAEPVTPSRSTPLRLQCSTPDNSPNIPLPTPSIPSESSETRLDLPQTTPRRATTPVRYATPVRQATPIRYATPVRQATPIRYATPVRQATPIRYATPVRQATPVRCATPMRHYSNTTPPSQRTPTGLAVTEMTSPRERAGIPPALTFPVTPTRTSPSMQRNPFPDGTPIRIPLRSQTPPSAQRPPRATLTPVSSKTAVSPHQTRLQWLSRKAEERQWTALQKNAQTELAQLDQHVQLARDTLMCLEGLAKLYIRSDVATVVSPLSVISQRVTETLLPTQPDITEERSRAAIIRLSERAPQVVAIRPSKADAGISLVQFYRHARLDSIEQILHQDIEAAASEASLLKQETLNNLQQQCNSFPVNAD